MSQREVGLLLAVGIIPFFSTRLLTDVLSINKDSLSIFFVELRRVFSQGFEGRLRILLSGPFPSWKTATDLEVISPPLSSTIQLANMGMHSINIILLYSILCWIAHNYRNYRSDTFTQCSILASTLFAVHPSRFQIVISDNIITSLSTLWLLSGVYFYLKYWECGKTQVRRAYLLYLASLGALLTCAVSASAPLLITFPSLLCLAVTLQAHFPIKSSSLKLSLPVTFALTSSFLVIVLLLLEVGLNTGFTRDMLTHIDRNWAPQKLIEGCSLSVRGVFRVVSRMFASVSIQFRPSSIYVRPKIEAWTHFIDVEKAAERMFLSSIQPSTISNFFKGWFSSSSQLISNVTTAGIVAVNQMTEEVAPPQVKISRGSSRRADEPAVKKEKMAINVMRKKAGTEAPPKIKISNKGGGALAAVGADEPSVEKRRETEENMFQSESLFHLFGVVATFLAILFSCMRVLVSLFFALLNPSDDSKSFGRTLSFKISVAVLMTFTLSLPSAVHNVHLSDTLALVQLQQLRESQTWLNRISLFGSTLESDFQASGSHCLLSPSEGELSEAKLQSAAELLFVDLCGCNYLIACFLSFLLGMLLYDTAYSRLLNTTKLSSESTNSRVKTNSRLFEFNPYRSTNVVNIFSPEKSSRSTTRTDPPTPDEVSEDDSGAAVGRDLFRQFGLARVAPSFADGGLVSSGVFVWISWLLTTVAFFLTAHTITVALSTV